MMSGNPFDLTGKVAVVTGSGAHGGIGHALAVGFAENGADVVTSDIDDEGISITVEQLLTLGRNSIGVHCDISNPEDVKLLFEEVDKVFGRTDILVNVPCAFPERARPHELSLNGWNKTLSVSLTGYFLCAQQAIRHMLKRKTRGSILNISSVAGLSAIGRGDFPYSVAKAGVNQLTKELAIEYAIEGIRVNAILPAQVRTPTLQVVIDNPQFGSATLVQQMLNGIPIGRFLEPADLVAAAVFLCSDGASAVTGVLLAVDGGNLALNPGGSTIWPSDL